MTYEVTLEIKEVLILLSILVFYKLIKIESASKQKLPINIKRHKKVNSFVSIRR